MSLDPVCRLRCPRGGAGSSVSFLSLNSLIVGDTSGTVSVLNIKRRRADLIVSCDTASVQKCSNLGMPLLAERQARSMFRESGGTVLHTAVLKGSAGSRILLQQQNSRMTLLDLNREACEGSFKTGVVSFCKFDVPKSFSSEGAPQSAKFDSIRDSLDASRTTVKKWERCKEPGVFINERVSAEGNEGNSTEFAGVPIFSASGFSHLSAHVFVAAAGDGDSVGIYDLRGLSQKNWRKDDNCQVVTPGLSMTLRENTARQALSGASRAGSVQCVGFDTHGKYLLAAYEYPSVALWDPREPREPVELLKLPETESPPTAMNVAWSRVWVASIEGEISLIKYDAGKAHAEMVQGARSIPTDETKSCTSLVENERVFESVVSTQPKNGRKTLSLSNVASANAFKSLISARPFVNPTSSRDLFVHFGGLDRGRLHLSCLAVRPDALMGVAGCSSGALRLYEGRRLKLLGAFKAHDAPVGAVAFSDSTGFFVSADTHGVVAVWNLYADSYHKS